jgi:CRISPR-associated endonuclease Csn1
VHAIVVSYKPDTGWDGALHNDTAYGPLTPTSKNGPNVVVRRPLATFVDWSDEEIRAGVRDPFLAAKIADVLSATDPTARKAALSTLTHSGGHQV